MLALDNESKFQKFVASMSKDNITMVILALDARNIFLQEPLLRLLQCCTTGTSGPDALANSQLSFKLSGPFQWFLAF